MKSSKSITLTFIFWSLLSLALHALYIDTPFVNLEYVFGEAVKNILDPYYKSGIQYYWTMQANPLGYAWVSSLIHYILGEPNGFWSFRIPSHLGFILILSSGAIFSCRLNSEEQKNFNLWCALTVFSPLIWIFSGRATADVLPVGLLMASFLLVFLGKEKPTFVKLGSVIFSFSILVKYHTLLMSLGFVYILFNQNNNKWDKELFKKCLQFFIFPITLLGFYLCIIYIKYDFFLMHANHKSTLQSQTSNITKVFFHYSYYLGLLVGPISIICISAKRKIFQKKLFIAPLFFFGSIFFTWINPGNGGVEMDYGPFDLVLNSPLIFFLKVLGGILFCFLFLDIFSEWREKNNAFAGFLLSVCVPYLIICSFTRPAQRYLIFLVPLLYYYLVFYRLKIQKTLSRFLGWGTVAIFVFVNVFAVGYQVVQAKASDNMAKWLIEKKMIKFTDPGSISPHSGQYFLPLSKNKKIYKVIESSGKVKKNMHSEEVAIFGITFKTYSLKENVF